MDVLRAFNDPASPEVAPARVRLQYAARLLREMSRPIAGIARECGFHVQAHLTRYFTPCYGTSPGRFRVMTRDATA